MATKINAGTKKGGKTAVLASKAVVTILSRPAPKSIPDDATATHTTESEAEWIARMAANAPPHQKQLANYNTLIGLPLALRHQSEIDLAKRALAHAQNGGDASMAGLALGLAAPAAPQPIWSRPMTKIDIAAELSIPLKTLYRLIKVGTYNVRKVSQKTTQIDLNTVPRECHAALS
jgi:hypothetical protein